MRNGKAFAVCKSDIWRSTNIDVNTHVLVYDNLEMEVSSCIACF